MYACAAQPAHTSAWAGLLTRSNEVPASVCDIIKMDGYAVVMHTQACSCKHTHTHTHTLNTKDEVYIESGETSNLYEIGVPRKCIGTEPYI